MRAMALVLLVGCARRAPETAPPPPPPPEVDPSRPLERGELQVRLSNPESVRSVEVSCPSGYRTRATLAPTLGGTVGVARATNLPDEPCEIWFKGGTPAAFSPVLAGQDLRCTIQGATALCAPMSR